MFVLRSNKIYSGKIGLSTQFRGSIKISREAQSQFALGKCNALELGQRGARVVVYDLGGSVWAAVAVPPAWRKQCWTKFEPLAEASDRPQ